MAVPARPDLGAYAVGQAAVDYEARVDWDALRSRRVTSVCQRMQTQGLDAVLVWKDENVRFLSGLRPQIIQGKSALLNGCLLRADGAMTLFLSGGEVDRVRVTMPWISDVHPIPIMEERGLIRGAYESVIAPVFAAADLSGARVGVDELAFGQLEQIRESLPEVSLCDGDAVMQFVRRVKGPDELAVMQEASAIAEALTEVAMDAVRPGVRENEIVAVAMSELYRLGGEMAHLATPFVASGERMSPPQRFPSDKVIREGDLVFIDIGAMWNGYFADMGRVTICGKPARKQQEIYTAVYHALEAARDAMRPGNTNVDVAEATVRAGSEFGFGDHFLSLFIGHGVGMGANEPPYVGEKMLGAETVELEAGMTLAIEPLIWIPGIRGGGGVRLEDTIVVAEGGGVALTRTRFDERLLVDG